MFRTGAPDLIRRSVQGGIISARNITRIADAATRFRQSGPAIMDGTGIYVRPPVIPQAVQLKRRFELKYDLSPTDGFGVAHPLPWTDGAYEADTNEDNEFEVYDPFKQFRGRGKDTYSSPHNQGSQGYAELMPDSKRWEIADLTPNALLIRGQAIEDWTPGATMKINEVVVMQPTGGLICDQDPAAPVDDEFEILDFFAWGGIAYVSVLAYWDEAAVAWKLAMKPCS